MVEIGLLQLQCRATELPTAGEFILDTQDSMVKKETMVR